MHVAVWHDAHESVEVLLSHGANLNIQDHRVRTFTEYCVPMRARAFGRIVWLRNVMMSNS